MYADNGTVRLIDVMPINEWRYYSDPWVFHRGGKNTKQNVLATSSFSHNYEASVMSVFTVIKSWMPRYCMCRRKAEQPNAIHLQGGCISPKKLFEYV